MSDVEAKEPVVVELGRTYRDEITGFTGVATVESEYRNGCIRVVLEAGLNGDGEMIKGYTVDVQQLVLVPEVPRVKGKIIRPKTQMDAMIKDTVTGIEGVVTARSTILGSMPEVAIQPKSCKKSGEPMEGYFFSEGRVELIKPAKAKKPVAAGEKPPGGPQSLEPTTAMNRRR